MSTATESLTYSRDSQGRWATNVDGVTITLVSDGAGWTPFAGIDSEYPREGDLRATRDEAVSDFVASGAHKDWERARSLRTADLRFRGSLALLAQSVKQAVSTEAPTLDPRDLHDVGTHFAAVVSWQVEREVGSLLLSLVDAERETGEAAVDGVHRLDVREAKRVLHDYAVNVVSEGPSTVSTGGLNGTAGLRAARDMRREVYTTILVGGFSRPTIVRRLDDAVRDANRLREVLSEEVDA